MAEANKQQVGGQHYKTAYEHWDLVINTGMGYLEGCATKYISRWRKKGGETDLQKAQHYVKKLSELAAVNTPRFIRSPFSADKISTHVDAFAKANELTIIERECVKLLAQWGTVADLEQAYVLISCISSQQHQTLVQVLSRGKNGPEQPVSEPAPVPLTEENKHAERAQTGEAKKG